MRKNTPHKSAKVIIAILSLSVSLSFMAGNNVAFQSSKPIARVEYWQQRQIQIEQHLLDKPALSKVKLLFLGDSITDFSGFKTNGMAREFGTKASLALHLKIPHKISAFPEIAPSTFFIAYSLKKMVDLVNWIAPN